MPKREKCASILESLPYDLAEILRVGSASEMIRMGYSRMFGKMFFVALFFTNRAKNGLFCVFFACQANSLR